MVQIKYTNIEDSNIILNMIYDCNVTSLFLLMPRILARAYAVRAHASNRMLTAVHFTATSVINNEDFLKVT